VTGVSRFVGPAVIGVAGGVDDPAMQAAKKGVIMSRRYR
jgi:hypothetical protein